MSQTLKIDNYGSLNVGEQTTLAADATAGSSVSLSVYNSQGHATNGIIIIGTLGSETSEKCTVSNVPDTSHIQVSSMAFNHNKFDKVTRLLGDKIKIYRASNVDGNLPADGHFSNIDTINIDIDQVSTDYTDPTGSSDYWYKFTYYNATNLTETSLADSVAGRGGAASNYCTVDSIRREAGLQNNRYIGDGQIDEKRQSAQSLINATLTGLYTIPFASPVNPLIAEITRKLAAGYLLTDDYGPTQSLDTRQGQQKIDYVTNDKGTGVLDRLNKKELTLTGLLGNDDSLAGSGGFKMYPDANTAGNGGGERMFSTTDRY